MAIAEAIVKLLNASLFPAYEVQQFTFYSAGMNAENAMQVTEEWIPVDVGVEVGRALECRIGIEYRMCPPGTFRKSEPKLNPDRLIALAGLGLNSIT